MFCATRQRTTDPRGGGSGARTARGLSLRSILSATAVVLTAILLAVLGAGGSYALLNSSASLSSATTIRSGTAALTLSALTLPTTALYPGAVVFAPVTVTNSGSVPLAVRATALTPPLAQTSLSGALTIGLAIAASAAVCSAGSVAPTWSGTFASASAASLGKTIPVGGSAILCVSVTLSSTAPATAQGQSATNFGIVIDGIQA